jgi:dTDP-L-rhamnose 4-epimerase
MSKNTCLITGGAGFIGCALSRELAGAFDELVVVDNLHPQIHADHRRPDALAPHAALHVADVTEAGTWDRLFADFDPTVVIHLAAETGTGQSLTEATRHAAVNVVGTAQLLDGLARHAMAPKRFVLSSSRAVYGEGAWRNAEGGLLYPGQRTRSQLEAGQWDFSGLSPRPFSAESTRPSPISVYGATKLTQEHLMSAWSHAFGSEVVTLRLQNVYGPGQSLTNSYTGILPLFARIAKAGQSIPLYEDGCMLRDFVFIDDVARALAKVALCGAPSAQPYDIGSGRAATIGETARIIAARYNAPTPHVCGKYRHGDVRHASSEIEQTRADLGWEPQVDLEEGLDRLCRWIDEQM